MPRVSIQQLLLAGAHFGHLTRRWNPKMRPYIFMEKNGVHILDLKKTESALEDAANRIGKIVADGGDVLFVGTKDQARDIMKEEAQRCSMHHVSERWLGGMLTNFRTIRNSVRVLEQEEAKATDGTYDRIGKKEQLEIERKKAKLEKVLGGIRHMKRLPSAVFVVDTLRESIAVAEARKLKIPVFAICDSNSDPDIIDFVIPANDDSFKSIAVISKCLSETIEEARMLRKDGHGAEGELHDPSKPQEDKGPARRRRRRDGGAPRQGGAPRGERPAAKADAKPEPKAEPKAEAKPEPKAEPKTDAPKEEK